MKSNAIIISKKDNVAISLGVINSGENIIIKTNNIIKKIVAKEEIPFGHKVSIENISPNTNIIKYGESIGASIKNIKEGQHVHTHNIESLRGRGDLE